jgi:SRSO17 transposase
MAQPPEEFRNYIGGLLGESERKNLSQMASNAVGVTYHRLHHFLTEAPWSALEVNERRLMVMNQCSQTRISRGFTLIVDDSPKNGIIHYYFLALAEVFGLLKLADLTTKNTDLGYHT